MIEYIAVPEAKANEERALAVVRADMGWSAGAGLLPLPGLDLVAIVGVQLKMLQSIAKIYGVPYNAGIVRPLLVALVNSGSGMLMGTAAASIVKGLPLIGTIAGMLSVPAFASASCWASGKVFIRHFESGGTFLDFAPDKARAYYAEQYAAAKSQI